MMATISPALNLVTLDPTSMISPQPSWPYSLPRCGQNTGLIPSIYQPGLDSFLVTRGMLGVRTYHSKGLGITKTRWRLELIYDRNIAMAHSSRVYFHQKSVFRCNRHWDFISGLSQAISPSGHQSRYLQSLASQKKIRWNNSSLTKAVVCLLVSGCRAICAMRAWS